MHASETPLTLPLVEHVLLWSMRVWVIGRLRDVDVTDHIREVYGQLQAVEASVYLELFMQALNRGATRTLDVNCVCYPEVTADESALLDVFALQQERCGEEALALLARMVTRNAAIAGCHSAGQLVLALNAAGQVLPRGSDASRRHAFLQYSSIYATSASPCLH